MSYCTCAMYFRELEEYCNSIEGTYGGLYKEVRATVISMYGKYYIKDMPKDKVEEANRIGKELVDYILMKKKEIES